MESKIQVKLLSLFNMVDADVVNEYREHTRTARKDGEFCLENTVWYIR